MTAPDPFAERQIRAAVGESACRDENERTEGLSESLELTEFTCECTEACDARISLTIAEYEGVRKDPTHFIAALGHLVVGVEVVVSETSRYQVVEKIGAAAQVATRLDPRACDDRAGRGLTLPPVLARVGHASHRCKVIVCTDTSGARVGRRPRLTVARRTSFRARIVTSALSPRAGGD